MSGLRSLMAESSSIDFARDQRLCNLVFPFTDRGRQTQPKQHPAFNQIRAVRKIDSGNRTLRASAGIACAVFSTRVIFRS